MSTWVLWVSINLLLCALRLLQEGIVLPAFELLVATMRLALPQCMMFSLCVGFIMIVVAEVHGNQFGVFTDSYATLSGSAINMVDLFANGMSLGDGEDLAMHNPSGYTIIFLFIVVLLFLILAQFFIAILVGSFDKAKEDQKEEDKRHALYQDHVREDEFLFGWLPKWGVLGRIFVGYSDVYDDWSYSIIDELEEKMRDKCKDPLGDGMNEDQLFKVLGETHFKKAKDRFKGPWTKA